MGTLRNIPGAVVIACWAVTAPPAFAQPATTDAAPDGEPVRYTMQPVEGGLMKLDTRTGRMTFCSARAGAWICELVPEERTAYEDEIGRLNEHIAALERNNVPPGVPDIAKPPLADAPHAPGAAGPKAGSGGATAQNDPGAGDPTDEDEVRDHMDRAMDMAEQVFRRFLDMVGRLKGESEKL